MRINPEDIPFAGDIIRAAADSGAEVYFVGGVVRDLLMRRRIHDVDITCFGIVYTEFAGLLAYMAGATYVPFKDNVRLVKGGFTIDVSKPRGETIKTDLQKRDFTINNLALTLKGEIIGDSYDLENALIRHVYPSVFDDDPLRILRAFRFVSECGFDIAPETSRLIADKADKINNVAKERIYQEIFRFFTGIYFDRAVTLFFRKSPKDLFKKENRTKNSAAYYLFPELVDSEDISQSNIFHRENVLKHSLSVAREIFKIARGLNIAEERRFVLVTAALLHDCGKKEAWLNNNRKNFIGHDEIGSRVAVEIMKRLGYPNKYIKKVSFLVKQHLKLTFFAVNGVRKIKLQRFVFENRDEIEDIILLSLADNRVKKFNMKRLYNIILRIRRAQQEIDMSRTKTVSGSELIDMGVEKGPEVSILLKEVHFRLAFGYLKSIEDVKNFLKEIRGK
ncbi:HD domain-containing protein [Flexistipes sinusarabici]|uniref:HD domain-containing protein n=1 Tax=Flexistipes sinusarabici TaxID=2352 RepID=UPI0026EC1C11|nr:HD domain-containing protein [Flexistipes sinusarabici]